MSLRSLAFSSALALVAGSLTACGNGSSAVPPVAGPGTWTVVAPMQNVRAELAAGALNGLVYAVGGYGDYEGNSRDLRSVEAYDPSTDTWTMKASMASGRTALGVGVVGNLLYAIGGDNGGSGVGTVEAYDPATNAWTARKPMPTPRSGLGVGVINNILYAVGGRNGTVYLKTVEAYDPSTDTWTTKAPMPTARAGAGVAVVNNVLYAIGGAYVGPLGFFGALGTVEAYDPSTNTWTAKALMPTQRQFPAIGVVNGTVYAIGGYEFGVSVKDSVEAYFPSADRWVAKTSMHETRYAPAAAVVNNVVIVAGGANRANPIQTAEKFTP